MIDQTHSERSEQEKGRRAWRVLADIAQPRRPAAERWVAAGLAAAVAPLQLPGAVVERLSTAALEAVMQAQHPSTPKSGHPPVILRVLVPATIEVAAASCGWGFFILERAAGDAALGEPERLEALPVPGAHLIEVYLYADVSTCKGGA